VTGPARAARSPARSWVPLASICVALGAPASCAAPYPPLSKRPPPGDARVVAPQPSALDTLAPAAPSSSEAAGPAPVPAPSRAAPPRLAVRVDGARLVDARGDPLRLTGVDHSGTEYSCIKGTGIFDGPTDDAMIDAIVSWRANAVRIPLNEDCWLGINGVDPALGGAVYAAAIVAFVERLHAHGLYVILDLHWTAPGATRASGQQPMVDRDHGPELWRSVAVAFAGDPAVVFDLFNEPFLSPAFTDADPWACWRDGCEVRFKGASYASAGMQELVDAVRGTGATQPLMLGGLTYANDLRGWRAHAPKDPLHALVASFHVYDFNPCVTAACWDARVRPLVAEVPVVTGEVGEKDCSHAFLDRYVAWADAAGVSYLAWTWNPWGGATARGCGTNRIVLVADWKGTPTPYGAGYRAHLARPSARAGDDTRAP
jgi:endoglucanase